MFRHDCISLPSTTEAMPRLLRWVHAACEGCSLLWRWCFTLAFSSDGCTEEKQLAGLLLPLCTLLPTSLSAGGTLKWVERGASDAIREIGRGKEKGWCTLGRHPCDPSRAAYVITGKRHRGRRFCSFFFLLPLLKHYSRLCSSY
jgi:hypothetical protein